MSTWYERFKADMDRLKLTVPADFGDVGAKAIEVATDVLVALYTKEPAARTVAGAKALKDVAYCAFAAGSAYDAFADDTKHRVDSVVVSAAMFIVLIHPELTPVGLMHVFAVARRHIDAGTAVRVTRDARHLRGGVRIRRILREQV